jgi:hypothetical protein
MTCRSNTDAADFIHLAKELNAKCPSPIEPNDNLLAQFSKICAGDTSPMAAAIGGLVAQVPVL